MLLNLTPISPATLPLSLSGVPRLVRPELLFNVSIRDTQAISLWGSSQNATISLPPLGSFSFQGSELLPLDVWTGKKAQYLLEGDLSPSSQLLSLSYLKDFTNHAFELLQTLSLGSLLSFPILPCIPLLE